MKKAVEKLLRMINEGESESKMEGIEEMLIESFDETVKEEKFYSLPTQKIFDFVKRSEIEDPKLLKELVSQISKSKEKEAVLILNIIDSNEATFDELIDIVSCLSQCPICKRIGELHESTMNLPERVYEHETIETKQENETLKQETKKVIYKSIYEAASEGNLDSIKYFIEQEHVDVNAKDKNCLNQTALHYAARKGQLNAVKILVEQFHADVNVIDTYGHSSLHDASYNNQLNVVKYLVEQCHASMTTSDYTPLHTAAGLGSLDVVKYFIEQCHQDYNVKDKRKMTPLHCACRNCNLCIVKYLVEQCHADIENESLPGETALYHAVISFYHELIIEKYLIEQCNAKISSFIISAANSDKKVKYLKSQKWKRAFGMK